MTRTKPTLLSALVARLSPLRAGNLRRRLMDRVTDAELAHGDGSREHTRALAILGRFEALAR